MVLTLKQRCGRKGLTMNKRLPKIWKPKTYIVISDRKTIEYETYHKKIAFDFAKEVSQDTNTKYYVFEKIES